MVGRATLLIDATTSGTLNSQLTLVGIVFALATWGYRRNEGHGAAGPAERVASRRGHEFGHGVSAFLAA
jgi:hypothetical protein